MQAEKSAATQSSEEFFSFFFSVFLSDPNFQVQSFKIFLKKKIFGNPKISYFQTAYEFAMN